MKSFLAKSLVAALTLAAQSARAQTPLVCAPDAVVATGLLEKFGESPVWAGRVRFAGIVANDKKVALVVTMAADGSWTAYMRDNEKSCILWTGDTGKVEQ